MSRILVTGGAGFIGSHVVDRYVAMGHDVLVADTLRTGSRANLNPAARFFELDVRSDAFADLVLGERPDVISHHAAQTMVRPSTEDPVFDTQVNVQGLLNLMQASVKAGVRKVIFASSGGTVYGTSDRLPISEDHPFSPESPYGISKAASEYYLRYYAANYPVRFTALRYANVFGERDELSSEHVITVFSRLLLRGEIPTIHWDGEQAKDYVHVADVADANALALDRGDNAAFNIGCGQPTSVNEIYRLLSGILGVAAEPKRGPKRVGDVRLVYFDCGKAGRELGWAPRVAFGDGLARTVAWYREQHG